MEITTTTERIRAARRSPLRGLAITEEHITDCVRHLDTSTEIDDVILAVDVLRSSGLYNPYALTLLITELENHQDQLAAEEQAWDVQPAPTIAALSAVPRSSNTPDPILGGGRNLESTHRFGWIAGEVLMLLILPVLLVAVGWHFLNEAAVSQHNGQVERDLSRVAVQMDALNTAENLEAGRVSFTSNLTPDTLPGQVAPWKSESDLSWEVSFRSGGWCLAGWATGSSYTENNPLYFDSTDYQAGRDPNGYATCRTNTDSAEEQTVDPSVKPGPVKPSPTPRQGTTSAPEPRPVPAP